MQSLGQPQKPPEIAGFCRAMLRFGNAVWPIVASA
jgi:hypothetical protein